MKEKEELDEFLDHFKMSLEDLAMNDCMDEERENLFMKGLKPYTSNGVTYYVPSAGESEYSFRWLELKNASGQLDSREKNHKLITCLDNMWEVSFKTELMDVYSRGEEDICSKGITLLLYRVGVAYPLFIKRMEPDLYSHSLTMDISDIKGRWEAGKYFLLVVNAKCDGDEYYLDTFCSHPRYSFSVLPDGRALEHPTIKHFSVSSDKVVELEWEGPVSKQDVYSLSMYNSDWVTMSDAGEFHAYRGRMKTRLFPSGYWMDGTYKMLLKHNEEPFLLVTFSWENQKMTTCSWEKLELTSPYYMLEKYITKDFRWHRLCSIPGCRSLRKAIASRYGHNVLNEWRKSYYLNCIEKRMHLSIAVWDGKYDSELARNVAELLNDSMEFHAENCELLVESRYSTDAFEEMRSVVSDCCHKVLCLHHLAALIANPNGKIFLHMLEEKLENDSTWALMLMGTSGEIRQLMEESSVLARYITEENRFYTERYSVQEQWRFLNAYFREMQFKLSPKAQSKLVDLLNTHQSIIGNWGREELKQWWKEVIFPRFMNRVLSVGKVKNMLDTLHVLEPRDFSFIEVPTPKDAFTDSVRELNEMVGLNQLKLHMTTLFNRARFEKMRQDMGLPVLGKGGYHMIFTGNPGTGKTTVAKLVGKIYHSLGLLSKGNVIVTERSKLVGRYLGETERNMMAVLEQAKGNVLFIDEAYSLCDNDDGNRRDFGCRVLESLLTVLAQKDPDMIVILAGYEKEMEQMLELNPGMKGRFPYKFSFEDYSADELFQIAGKLLERSAYVLTTEAACLLRETLQETVVHKDAFFHNARWVEQYILDGVISAMSDRLMHASLCLENREVFQTIEVQDIEKAYQKMKLKPSGVSMPRKRIGFVA